MKAEHLKEWLWAATREKDQDTKTWDKVVSVIHVAFMEGYILEALMQTTMVLIPKGNGQYRGIGLVEIIWKVCTSIVSSRLQRSIVLHDFIHGFRQGSGTGTSIMEAKLEQQLAEIIHKPFSSLHRRQEGLLFTGPKQMHGGQSACWDSDERCPGKRMTSCGRRIWWVGDQGRPCGGMNSCGSYDGNQNSRKGKVRYITISNRVQLLISY